LEFSLMEIPPAFPMTLEDCIMHQALTLLGDGSPKFLLSFAGRIDDVRLRKAVRFSLDAEPILGCRMVEGHWKPVWQRRPDLDEIPLCEVAESSDGQPHVARFLGTPIDSARDPLVKVMVVRGASDTVCVKVAHEVADGPSAKDYVHFLVRLYRRLKEDPAYLPPTNPTGVRTISEVFRHVGLWQRLAEVYRRRSTRRQPGGDRREWLLPLCEGADRRTGCVYLLMKLPPERVQLLKEYGWQRKATITPVFLAAFYRALRAIGQPVDEDAVAIGTTMDVRRFLPPQRRSTTPGNVSALVHFPVNGERDSTFDELVDHLMAQLQQALRDPYQIMGPPEIAMDLIARSLGVPLTRLLLSGMVKIGARGLRAKRSVMSLLINYGTMAPEPGEDAERIVDVNFLGGAVQLGAIQLGVSEFEEKMTVAAGFSERFIEEAVVRRLLEELDRALPFFSGTPAEIASIK
jgi:NRPS condensation-like uncharacterized protein